MLCFLRTSNHPKFRVLKYKLMTVYISSLSKDNRRFSTNRYYFNGFCACSKELNSNTKSLETLSETRHVKWKLIVRQSPNGPSRQASSRRSLVEKKTKLGDGLIDGPPRLQRTITLSVMTKHNPSN